MVAAMAVPVKARAELVMNSFMMNEWCLMLEKNIVNYYFAGDSFLCKNIITKLALVEVKVHESKL